MAERRKVLITGCGRSGTTYMASVLRKAGLAVRHEVMGDDGCSSWYFAPREVPWFPPAHKSDPNKRHADGIVDVEFDITLHVVRHPIKVIPSAFATFEKANWKFVGQFIKDIDPRYPRLVNAIRYWLRWNKLVSKERPDAYRFRIEDIDTEWPVILDLLGQPQCSVPDVSRTINRNSGFRAAPKVTWEQLESVDALSVCAVKRYAKELGYEL